jgi:hypothetical protein
MWIVLLTMRSEHVDQTACYGPYESRNEADEETHSFNLVDWSASIHELLPPRSTGEGK